MIYGVAALAAGFVAAVFLSGLVLFWKLPDSPSRHWLLLFGIVVLPSLALFLGANAAMEEAKRPQFCGSCHVMDHFINDMRDPGSTTLAAVHYQNRFILENQCYTCHTGYTIFGPLKAKMAGIRHVWKYETDLYSRPIRLHDPFDFGTCLHCHGEARVFLEKHEEETRRMIHSREATCLDCHAPVHRAQEEAP
jgi:nitrate/TMAO reductase-like tetraheme cytochrome c subunit